MTSFMRRVRQFTDQLGARRGRPVVIASRVPGTIEKCLNIGLDVKTWLEDDLVDILIGGGGYSPFTIRISDFTQLADPYEVPVYPCINQGVAFGLAGSWTNFTPVTRALASTWYREGARGVYLWNLGTPFEYLTGDKLEEKRRKCYECLYEIGDPQVILRRDKYYGLDSMARHRIGDHCPYAFVSSAPFLPLHLERGVAHQLPLMIGDDVIGATEAGVLRTIRLSLNMEGSVTADELRVQLNGQPLPDASLSSEPGKTLGRLEYAVHAPILKVGQNLLQLVREGDADSDPIVRLDSVHVELDYN